MREAVMADIITLAIISVLWGFKLLSLGEGIIIMMLLGIFTYIVKQRGQK